MNDFPALNGHPVTEAHARRCRENGHAVHTVNGKATGVCPRCGEVAATDGNTRYALVRNLKVGDRVYLGSDHPMQLTEVAHLGGSLTELHGPGGIVLRKDSREAVFVAS